MIGAGNAAIGSRSKGLAGALFLVLVLLPLVIGAGPSRVRLKVSFQWEGTDSGYHGRPSYFLIRNDLELDSFWRSHEPGGFMPHIDFSKNMIFVWTPGKTMKEFRPTKVVRFVFEKGRYNLLLQIERIDPGGFWRNPYLIAILEKVEKADIRVFRVGDRIRGEPPVMPLFTIWDMEGELKPPVIAAVVKRAPPAKPEVQAAPEPAVAPATKPVATAAAAKSEPKPTADAQKPPVTAATSGSSGGAKPPTSGSGSSGAAANSPAGSGGSGQAAAAGGKASGTSDPFGDAFNLDF